MTTVELAAGELSSYIWGMLPFVLLSLTVVVPFADSDHRFTLDLPGCWRPGPLAADASGASFQSTRGGELALAAVRVFPEASSPKPAQALRAWSVGLGKLPGFVLVEEGSTVLGGLPAVRRRYALALDDQPEVTKLAEDRAVVVRGTLYVVHVEALRKQFNSWAPDFDHLFANFRVGADAPVPNKPVLAGEWLMRGTNDELLSLHADGSFLFAGVSGSYRVWGRSLWLCNENGEDEQFNYRLVKGELLLHREGWEEPVRYVKKVEGEALAPLPAKRSQP